MNIVENEVETSNFLPKQRNIRIVETSKNDGVSSSGLSCRKILWLLIFGGTAVHYLNRLIINIAIVEMIQPRNTSERTLQNEFECYSKPLLLQESTNVTNFENSTLRLNNISERRFSIEKTLLDLFHWNYERDGFNWDENVQAMILGSYFWLHWLTQIPGGILAKRYGSKVVFGLGNVSGCLICFITPIIAYFSLTGVIFLRIISGMLTGVCYPAINHITANWIPPNERSGFMTAYLGNSIGTAFFYPLFGYILQHTSWEWIFHLSGLIGIIWYILWQYCVYDSPDEHPRIHLDEKKFIQSKLGETIDKNSGKSKISTPWMAMFKSIPLWMCIIGQFGGLWGLYTTFTQAPTYFKIIHGWSLGMTGIISGLPHLTRVIFAYLFSMFGDFLLRTNRIATTKLRKIATFVSCILNGIFVFALAFTGCNGIAAAIFMVTATTLHGATGTGILANTVDISPNYAGIIFGITSTISVLPGFISPFIVGVLTLSNQTTTQWKYVYLISSTILISTGCLYLVFGDCKVQPWNYYGQTKAETNNDEEDLRDDNDNNKEKHTSHNKDRI